MYFYNNLIKLFKKCFQSKVTLSVSLPLFLPSDGLDLSDTALANVLETPGFSAEPIICSGGLILPLRGVAKKEDKGMVYLWGFKNYILLY